MDVQSSMTSAVCTHPRMRRMNEVALLRQLHVHGQSSRVELAALLKLDAKTVTNLVRDLLKKKYLKPAGITRLDRGRPRQMLQLNRRLLQAIGIHLQEDKVQGAMIDLDGHIRSKLSAPLPRTGGQKALVESLRTMTRQLLRESRGAVMGVGLAFPGIYDTRERRIVECAHLPAWKGVCLPTLLEGVYQGPFFFDTFTRTKALAELWHGAARSLENFVLIDAGVGIGCAAVNQGRIQTGETHLAGEIGHMIIDRQGLPCRCGRRGCLETLSSLDAIRRRIQPIVKKTPRPLPVLTMALLAENDPEVRAAVTDAGQALGLALANLVQLLSPAVVVLAGDSLELGPAFIQAVRNGLIEYSMPVFRDAVRVIPGTLGENGALLGSGVLVLQSLFEI